MPAALDGLLAAARRALPGVQVLDGQPVQGQLADDTVIVGFSPARPSVDAAVDVAGQGADRRERYDIVCLASSLFGSTVAKTRRDRAFALFEAVAAEVDRDRTLGGAVMRARASAATFMQAQTPDGASATVEFLIHCDGFAS